jgi:hypothetical protein
MAGRLNKKKINAKNVICGIFQNSNWGWESRKDKAESAAGLSFKKKNWNFAQWQMMMVALRRVYMSQSAEPFRIDSSQSAQLFLEIQVDSSQSAQPCRIDSGKTEPSRSEAIIFD